MNIDYIDDQTVRSHLTMVACIDLMARTQVAISRGDITLPLRHSMSLTDEDNSLLIMPGALQDRAVFGAKLLSLFPANPASGRPVIQGAILLFDNNSGAAIAFVEAASVTAIRTAAASAAATRVLANSDSRRLAILGCGVQATTHLEAMLAVRPIEEVRVWGRNLDKAEAFVTRHSQANGNSLKMYAAVTPEEAVAGADIVCTVTGSPEPILKGGILSAGVHLNLVGAHSPKTREIDAAGLRGTKIFTEVNEFAWQEAGDILLAIQEGTIVEANVIGEIGEVIEGKLPGRTHRDEVTVYKNLGNTAQDLAAASYVYDQTKSNSR